MVGLTPVLAHRSRRRDAALAGVLLALAVVAWLVTDRRMDGMEAMPGGAMLGSLGFYVTVWVVMMAAMMLPSIAPMVTVFERMRAGYAARGEADPPEATALFVAGYFVVWTAVGVAAYGLLAALRHVPIAWGGTGHVVAGGVVISAAIYQLTPLKDACLVRCRGPLMFLAQRWRHGRAGALRLGAEHGAWCVGCCWALMATLFALGVMSVGWMALVAGLIAVEKLLPHKELANRAVALVLLAIGAALVAGPDVLPGMPMS